MTTKRSIFAAISAVQAELATKGIGKDGKNKFDNYNYRSIDGLLNTLSPILAKHGLILIPNVDNRTVTVVPTSKGGTQNHVIVDVTYNFYDISGDHVAHSVMGEAMDRGDKGLNKALTSAFKNMLFQALCIPLQGAAEDTETESPERGPHQVATQQPVPIAEYAEQGAATPTPVLSKNQRADITSLLTSTRADTKQFLGWLGGYGSVNEIPSSQYLRAIGALKKKEQVMRNNGEPSALEAAKAQGAAKAAGDKSPTKQSTLDEAFPSE
jgi:hypothetical protein